MNKIVAAVVVAVSTLALSAGLSPVTAASMASAMPWCAMPPTACSPPGPRCC